MNDSDLNERPFQNTKINAMQINTLIEGNAFEQLKKLKAASVDVIYLDPPFFTQRKHQLKNRDNTKSYQFNDTWKTLTEYNNFLKKTLKECYRVLRDTGSIFFHCDKTAAHHIRILLDEIFGVEQFRNEIIWTYRRWSNTKKGLLNSHQNIYFYSKTSDYQFNIIYTDYSPTTNLDQILQDRIRTPEGKTTYKRNKKNETILTKEKKGVPLSDVWEIPYLNPKAKERVGYPTQKPVLLLQRILEIASKEGDTILDPMCGSGTTLVAAKSLNRNYIGIDQSPDAIALAHQRLKEMVISSSELLEKGLDTYFSKSSQEMAILQSLEAFPVQRNSGIDGFLKAFINGKPVPIKIQSAEESLIEAYQKLLKATDSSKFDLKILIKTRVTQVDFKIIPDVLILETLNLQLEQFSLPLFLEREH